MTAPTEAEIREALGDPTDLVGADISDNLRDAIAPLLDSDQALVRAGWVEDFYPPANHPGTLWADLQPSEAKELHDAIFAAIDEIEFEAAKQLVDRLVAVGVAFAAAHPDIPRGHWPSGRTNAGDRADVPREPAEAELVPA